MIENQSDIRDWVIYKITNPNGKVYIGKTSNWYNRHSNYKNFKTAKQVHKQKILYSSFLKYGFDAHKIEIIEEFQSDSNYCSGKEIFWIKSYMSNTCKYPKMNGMNLTDGGEGNLGWKRPLESIEEIRRKNKGRKRTEEQRKRISESLKGRKGRIGYKLSEEHKNILRTKQLGRKRKECEKENCRKGQLAYNKKLGRTIIQLDKNNNIIREFDFLYEVGNFFNVTESTARRFMKKIGISKKINAILKYKKDI